MISIRTTKSIKFKLFEMMLFKNETWIIDNVNELAKQRCALFEREMHLSTRYKLYRIPYG